MAGRAEVECLVAAEHAMLLARESFNCPDDCRTRLHGQMKLAGWDSNAPNGI
jgi:hypothetical protein